VVGRLSHNEQKHALQYVTCACFAHFGQDSATFFSSMQVFLFNVKFNTLYVPALSYESVHNLCMLHSVYVWTGIFSFITTMDWYIYLFI